MVRTHFDRAAGWDDLASGFNWQAPIPGVEFALRRAAASVISLAPSDDYSYRGSCLREGLRRERSLRRPVPKERAAQAVSRVS